MRKISKMLVAFILLLSILCFTQISFAECLHPNVNHSYSIYYNLGSSGHCIQKVCKCLSCGEILGGCPQPGTTPTLQHTWKQKKTTYVSNGELNHTATVYNQCVCGATEQITSTTAHKFVVTGNKHGPKQLHFVYFKCACGQTKTESYSCPGDPCILYSAGVHDD